MLVHASPRVLVAEGQTSRPVNPKVSILQGCPTSVALAKAYLFRALETLHALYPDFDISSWVDELGFDGCGASVEELVYEVTSLYLKVVKLLWSRNLTINTRKTGFLCSHASLRKALRAHFKQHFPGFVLPAPLDCIRDLGIDNSGGRMRRLPTSKLPVTKSLRRAANLKHTPRKLRKSLIRTNVLASGLGGTQGVGLAPSSCKAYRARVARGCLTTAWRLFCEESIDPLHKALLQHVSGFFDTVSSFPSSWVRRLRQSWRFAYNRLSTKQPRWYYARGPMTNSRTFIGQPRTSTHGQTGMGIVIVLISRLVFCSPS